MNFTNRDSNTQQPQRGSAQSSTPSVAGPLNNTLKHAGKKSYDWVRGTLGLMLISVTIIILGLVYLLHVGNPNESRYVDNNHLQAVFLQGNQVYFGHIKAVNDKYINLQGIFYLNSSSANGSSSTNKSDNSLSLVKLGCELHGPYDMMVLNQSQVMFWENLRSDGQVAKAVAQFNQQNPKGQTCTQNNQSTGQASSTNTQNATTPNAKQ
ncbi:MAG TPA: hypothetical protein VLG11_03165 [Candidatus Saccharimonadales bacterium]|nr:hypothetical protein [Candidatus Saccharimonadales bacterium]